MPTANQSCVASSYKVSRLLRLAVKRLTEANPIIRPVPFSGALEEATEMALNINEYKRKWPKGLVVYQNSLQYPLHEADCDFLATTGLPKGIEPEWSFSGAVSEHNPCYFQIGTHCLAPLLIGPDRRVVSFWHDGNYRSYNASVIQLAESLTLKKKIGQRMFRVESYDDLNEIIVALLLIDERMDDGAYWQNYVEELRLEVYERSLSR
jgi:hypothetical protein